MPRARRLATITGPAAWGLVVATLGGCPGPVAAPCNSDADCADDEACTLGRCAYDEPPPDDGDDAGAADAGTVDAGALDAGTLDAGTLDAGTLDAGVDAGPPDAGGCAADQHDGGDGACVALDACSPGFGFFFLDDDGDGVGSGPKSTDCAALPLSPGRSDVDTDCLPADPLRFQLQQGFDDRDLDGVTAGPLEACVGDVPEQGLLAAASGAPHLARVQGATTSTGNGNNWNDLSNASGCCGGTTVADLDPNADTAALTLHDVLCLAEPPSIELVRVRAHVRLPAGQAPQDLALDVTIVEGGATRATRSATTTWLGGTFTDVVLDGTLADWGIVATDPAVLCNELLDLRLVVRANGSYGANVELDYAVVELLGGDDCDPGDGTAFSPHDLFEDSDGDNYAGGPVLATCVGTDELVAWRVLWNDDCDDTDGDAHPGQSNYFTSQRNGGGWDYNCNGSTDKRSIAYATGCAEDAADPTICVETGGSTRTGSCGASVDSDYCRASAPCDLVQDTTTQACR